MSSWLVHSVDVSLDVLNRVEEAERDACNARGVWCPLATLPLHSLGDLSPQIVSEEGTADSGAELVASLSNFGGGEGFVEGGKL